MRIFIAIDLPEPARDALERLQRRLPFGRIAAPETLHLTLAFGGEQPDARIEALHEELARIEAPAMTLNIRGLGSFGKQSPRVVFADTGDSAPLLALHRQVLGAMRAAGIAPPRTRFRPHVTLARFGRQPAAREQAALARFLAENAGFFIPPFGIADFVLFASTLCRDGPRHEALARYPLPSARAYL